MVERRTKFSLVAGAAVACLAITAVVSAGDPDGSAGPVDPAFSGVWQLRLVDEHQEAWTSIFDIGITGDYTLVIAAPPSKPEPPDEDGKIEAKAGHWKLVAKSGRTDEGTYSISKEGVTIQGKKGKAHLWKRVVQKLPGLFEPPPAIATAPTLDVPPDAKAYLEGVDLLAAAKFPEAIAAFDRSVQARPDFYASLLARGIAKVFAEKFQEAGADLLAASQHQPPPAKSENPTLNGQPLGPGTALFGTNFQHLCAMWGNFCGLLASGKPLENTGVGGSPDIGIWGDYQTDRLPLINLAGLYSKDKAAARALFPAYAARTAFRAKFDAIAGWPQLGAAIWEEAQERFRQKDYERAFELVNGLFSKTMNPWLGELHARLLVHLGAPLQARHEFTYLATLYPAMPEAYLGRALACAKLGDVPRARADLETARTLNAAITKDAEPEIVAALGAGDASGSESLADLLAAVEKSVRDDEPLEKRLGRATVLLRASMAQRRFGDETFQAELKKRHDAIREKPLDADRLAELGEFLSWERSPAGVRIEPGSPFVPVRLASASLEHAWEDQSLRAALRINPDHVKALVWYAGLFLETADEDHAMPLLERALKIRRDIPEVFDLLGAMAQNASDLKYAAAAKEREDKVSGTTTYVNSRGDFLYREVNYRSANAEELARAAEYERQAGVLDKYFEQCQAAVLKSIDERVQSGKATAADWDYKGRIHNRRSQFEEAKAAYEKAIEKDPGFARAHEHLAETLFSMKKPEAAVEESSLALNLRDTNAGVALAVAWYEIERKDFGLARKALDRARAIDPADARAFAFLAVACMLEADSQKEAPAKQKLREEAVVSFRIAFTLEEARARLMGMSFQPGAKGPIEPQVAALALACLNGLGRAYLDLGAAATAGPIFAGNAATAERVDGSRWREELPYGKLPWPRPPQAPRVSEDVFTHLAWARTGEAYAYSAQGKKQEAVQRCVLVQSFWNASKRGSCPSPTVAPAILTVEALLAQLKVSLPRVRDKEPVGDWGLWGGTSK
jgi:tetratricopeptide (TPR) repeat protein